MDSEGNRFRVNGKFMLQHFLEPVSVQYCGIFADTHNRNGRICQSECMFCAALSETGLKKMMRGQVLSCHKFASL